MLGKSRFVPIVLVVVLTIAAFGAGYGTGQRSQAASSTRAQGMRLLETLLNRVHDTYIDPTVSEQPLFLGAAKGMLDALGDPYTRFMDPRAYSDFRQDQIKGFFFGIGIFIDLKDNQLIVVQPIRGTPAARAGLRAGDRIIKIGGVSTEGMALQEAVTRIRGPKGTTAVLTIRRGDRDFDASMVRDRIELASGEGAETLDEATRTALTQAHFGYIKLTVFNETTAKTFDRLFSEVQRAGGKGLILDLRHNGGGLLDISLEVADRFVPAGQPLVHTVDRKGNRTTERATSRLKIGMPVVVLVDEFTASASEIVSGALQDSGVGTLVGVKTFGKGVIQSIVDLPMGAGAAITTAKYLTPKERDIHKKGIVPDVIAGEPEEALRARLRGKPEAEIEQQAEHMRADQLNRAIETLKKKMTKSEHVPADRVA